MKYPRPKPCINCGGKIKRWIDSDGEFCSNRFTCEQCGLDWSTDTDRMWFTKSYDGGRTTTDGTRERVIRADIEEWNSLDRDTLRECPLCKGTDVVLSLGAYFPQIICNSCHMRYCLESHDANALRKKWNNRKSEDEE